MNIGVYARGNRALLRDRQWPGQPPATARLLSRPLGSPALKSRWSRTSRTTREPVTTLLPRTHDFPGPKRPLACHGQSRDSGRNPAEARDVSRVSGYARTRFRRPLLYPAELRAQNVTKDTGSTRTFRPVTVMRSMRSIRLGRGRRPRLPARVGQMDRIRWQVARRHRARRRRQHLGALRQRSWRRFRCRDQPVLIPGLPLAGSVIREPVCVRSRDCRGLAPACEESHHCSQRDKRSRRRLDRRRNTRPVASWLTLPDCNAVEAPRGSRSVS